MGESTYERPVDVPAALTGPESGDEELPDGVEVCFDESGAKYYFDARSGESSWERPKAVRAFNKVKMMASMGAFSIEGKQAPRKVAGRAAEAADEEEEAVVVANEEALAAAGYELCSDEAGVTYYYNTATG